MDNEIKNSMSMFWKDNKKFALDDKIFAWIEPNACLFP